MWPRLRARKEVDSQFFAGEDIAPVVAPEAIGGIQALRDLRLLRWLKEPLGPSAFRLRYMPGVRSRSDNVWLLEAIEVLAQAIEFESTRQRVDLRRVFGFYCSRNRLRDFESIEAMHAVTGRSSPWAIEESERLLASIIRSNEGRVEFDEVVNTGRLWWGNTDGSHRMAAVIASARYQCIPFEIEGIVSSWRLNFTALETFESNWGAWVMSSADIGMRLRMHPSQMDRFVVIPGFLDLEWPPPMLITERPFRELSSAFCALLYELMQRNAVVPLQGYVRAIAQEML